MSIAALSAPNPIANQKSKPSDATQTARFSWSKLELNVRLVKIIQQTLGWQEPTALQSNAIVESSLSDVILIGRPGCGKTGAFILPILNDLIESLTTVQSGSESNSFAMILEPSKELCYQVATICSMITKKLEPDFNIRICDTSRLNNEEIQDQLSLNPQIIITTPSRIVPFLAHNSNVASNLKYIVLDEADLILSFGYKEDIVAMIPYFPSKKRMILTTATFNDSINQMKPLLLRKPTTVKLKESEYELNENLMHYKIECQNDEKYTILFSLFKLHLLTDKTLIFVNSVNQSYKVKIFLAQFGINSCVLNPELPLNSRLLAIKNFNSGRFNLLISSDFTIQEMEKFTGMEQKEIDNADYAIDKEFNLSRGIDFVNVKNVLNFDCPTSVTAYIHRAGRTTRMNKQGVVLTLLPRDGTNKKEQQSLFEEIYQLTDKNVKQFAFKLDEVEALKYRCSDIMNKITKQAVKSYRIQEIKTQLLDSKKLKDYFAQHPTDQFLLQKSIKRQMIPKQAHLDFLPEYLVPNLMKKTNINSFTSSSDNAVRKMNGKTVLKATKEKSKDSSNFFNIGVMSNKERKTRKKNKTKKGKKQGQRKAKKVIKVKKSQML